MGSLTYRSVVEACYAIILSGNKPSLRKIRARTGGSLSTVLKHYQQWSEEQTVIKKMDMELSEPFRQAVLVEFARATHTLQQTLTAQIDSEKRQLKETQELLVEHEAKVSELSETLSTQQKAAEQTQLAFKKALSAAQALAADGAKREAALQSQMDTLRQALQASEIKTAVLDNRRQELDKQNQKLEQELKIINK